jgi:hypothetical protein
MPNGRRRSQRGRAANQRRTQQAGRRTPAAAASAELAATAADPMSPADIAQVLHQSIIEGKPTVPLSLSDDNADAVISEILKIRVWACSSAMVLDSLDQLDNTGAPETVKAALGQAALVGSLAHDIQQHVVHGSVGESLAVKVSQDLMLMDPSDTAVCAVAESVMELTTWECTQEHILQMLPQLEAAGVHTAILTALRVTAHSHTTDADHKMTHVVVDDPLSFAKASARSLTRILTGVGPSFKVWRDSLDRLLQQFSIDDFVAAFAQVSDWGCTDEQAMRMLQAMRTSDVPAPIVEAFRKSACVTTTVADSAMRAEFGLQCSRAPAIEEAPEMIDPEPQPLECSTCCNPFSGDDLFGCDTEQCDYLQCTTCILKGKGSVCTRPGCYRLHWNCPACTEPAGTEAVLELTDDRFSKEDVLLALKSSREDMLRTVTAAHEELDAMMTRAVEGATRFGNDMNAQLERLREF